MQLSYVDDVNNRPQRRLFYKTELDLTDRDLRILRFILDMKFASKEDLARKFFWNISEPKERASFLRARDRLYKLQLNKLIVPVKFQGEAKNYYMGNWKTYYAVINGFEDFLPCKPSKSPDYQNFFHDRQVLESRLLLEGSQKITDWISDRRLRHFPELAGGPQNSQVPDGIFTQSDGKKVAFELEIARKENKAYAEKIKRYVQMIRSRDPSSRVFESVHFVCLKDTVRRLISDSVRIYGDLFKIQSWTEFVAENSGLQSAH